MNIKRYCLATLVVFVVMLILGWLAPMFAGGLYHATVNLWRSATEQMELLGWTILGIALFSAFFCLIYVKAFGDKGMVGGTVYGLLVGLMMSSTAFILYGMLPVPISVVTWWVVSGLVETIVAGILVGAIYKK